MRRHERRAVHTTPKSPCLAEQRTHIRGRRAPWAGVDKRTAIKIQVENVICGGTRLDNRKVNRNDGICDRHHEPVREKCSWEGPKTYLRSALCGVRCDAEARARVDVV